MKSTTIINQLAFEVWDSINEYQLAKFSFLQAVAKTAKMTVGSRQEVSDLYKSYRKKVKQPRKLKGVRSDSMSVNYTEEQVELMKTIYGSNPTRQTVEKLAEELNKSVKSVIGKLSREGVYQKSVYKTKTGENPETKKEIVLR